MRLLDAFCGAGGAAVGYHRADFDEIVGVDIKPQPRFPFHFVQGDALDYIKAHGHEFDAIHASPPCQRYSSSTPPTHRQAHPDLVPETQRLLRCLSQPYVIENVPQAPLFTSLVLCGEALGLTAIAGRFALRRHRAFETNVMILAPECVHRLPVITVVGHGTPSGQRGKWDGLDHRAAHRKEVMGINWMNRGELSEAVPPAYTEFIGRQLLQAIRR